MAATVTIINPCPGAITPTLNGSELPQIDGTEGGTTFHSLDAQFEPQNTLVVWFGMSRTYSFQLDVDPTFSGAQLFVFMGVAILMGTDVGEILAQVEGTLVGDDAARA
jgi:hypothetical protein